VLPFANIDPALIQLGPSSIVTLWCSSFSWKRRKTRAIHGVPPIKYDWPNPQCA